MKNCKAKADIYPSKAKYFYDEFAFRFLFKAKRRSETEYYWIVLLLLLYDIQQDLELPQKSFRLNIMKISSPKSLSDIRMGCQMFSSS